MYDATRRLKNPTLIPETSSGFWLHGRQLFVLKAVDRLSAQALEEKKKGDDEHEGRNLHLLKEGYIRDGTLAAQDLSFADLAKRRASFQERKRKLSKHPNLFVSKTRLAVQNLPKSVDEKQLKKLVIDCSKMWIQDITEAEEQKKLGKSEKVELERLKSSGEKLNGRVIIKQVKIVRDKFRLDPKESKELLASQEANTDMSLSQKTKLLGQSKGYGFIEFGSHIHALGCLRRMNNNPNLLPKNRRIIVEFAVENTSILEKRMKRYKSESPNEKDVTQKQDAPKGAPLRKSPLSVKDKSVTQKKVTGKKQEQPRLSENVDRKRKHTSETETAVEQTIKQQQPRELATAKKQSSKKRKNETDDFDAMVNQYKKRLTTTSEGKPREANSRWFE